LKLIKKISKNYILFLIFFVFNLFNLSAEENNLRELKLTQTEKKMINNKFAINRMMSRAEAFINAPYKHNLLDKREKEELILNFEEFDCIIFVEMMLAFYLNDVLEIPVDKAVKKLRYRKKRVDFLHRTHYLSDWIINNQNILRNVTTKFKRKFNIFYMSRNYKKYWQLAKNRQWIRKIRDRERFLSKKIFSYIPQKKIKDNLDLIKHGDLILFTTSIRGLDFSHIGFAYRKPNNQVHLLHASTTHGKVVISEKNLVDYVQSVRRHDGIVILRLKSF
jgi:hypothetical protein